MSLLIPGGIVLGYFGYPLLSAKPPQELYYDKAMDTIRGDMTLVMATGNWDRLSETIPDLESSIAAFYEQQNAELWQRFLYGRPSPEVASDTLLKEALVILATAKGDQKAVATAKGKLDQALALNPGLPYASQLQIGAGDINNLSLEALVAQRDLEMLFGENPQQRTPSQTEQNQSNQSQDGQVQPGTPNNNNSNTQNNQSAQPAQPVQPQPQTNPHSQQNSPNISGHGESNDGI
jgi:hypothetical protein